MVERSGSDEPEPTGWAFVRMMVREFVRDVRHPTPLTVRYLRCDGCTGVTPHARQVSFGSHGVLEAVCDLCAHAQPRTVGDEVPAEVTVTCVGRRHRRIGLKRSRRPCGRVFEVPAAAPVVLCPWCSTVQPGPGETR